MSGVEQQEAGWLWWAGSDGEHYTSSHATREDAIAALYGEAGYIVEARQDPVRVADWIGADDVLERADEYLADSEFGHIDGDPLFEATPEQQRDLEERLKRACDEWQAAHGLIFKPWRFTASRNEARIEAIDPIDLGEACDAGVVDHA